MRVVGVKSQQATTRESSPAHQLAFRFHQDFALEGVDYYSAGLHVIERMRPDERLTLVVQLQDMVSNYPGKDQRGLRNAWKRLGAQSGGRTLDLRGHIERWLKAAKAESGVKHDV